MSPLFKSEFLDQISYIEGLQIQENGRSALLKGSDQHLIYGLEHFPVMTLGQRAQFEDECQLSEEEVQKKGFDIQRTDRGGQLTIHSPGQLVVYPIFNLRSLKLGVREFVDLLLEVTSQMFLSYGVEVKRVCGRPGLFTEAGKIAFIGLRISRGISTHGLSINVSNDIEAFSSVRSCGIAGQAHDSFFARGVTVDTKDVFQTWVDCFEKERS